MSQMMKALEGEQETTNKMEIELAWLSSESSQQTDSLILNSARALSTFLMLLLGWGIEKVLKKKRGLNM